MNEPLPATTNEMGKLARRHLRLGWRVLLLFLSLGLVLEFLHGFKVGWYLDTSNETRRLMWTLAHAHGSLLGLVHIALGVTFRFAASAPLRSAAFAGACLNTATILLPGGFLAGGVFVHAGDPGVGVFLVPIGALALLIGVATTAFRVTPGLGGSHQD